MHYASRALLNLTVITIVIVAVSATSWGQKAQTGQESDHLTARKMAEVTNIKELLTEQVNAWNEGDIDRFMVTYWRSPKLTFSSGGQTTRGWQATLDRYKKKYHSRELMGTLRFDQIEVSVLAENVALCLGRWRLTRKEDEPHGNFSLILKKIDGKWRIVHDHSSTLEEQN